MCQVKEKIDLPTREMAEAFIVWGSSHGVPVKELTEFKRKDGPALANQLKSIKDQLKKESDQKLLCQLFNYTTRFSAPWVLVDDKKSPDGIALLIDQYDELLCPYRPQFKIRRFLKSLGDLWSFRVEHLLPFIDSPSSALGFVNDAPQRDPYWNLAVFPAQAARDPYLQKYVTRIAAVLEGVDQGHLPAEFYPEVRAIVREIQKETCQNHLITFIEYSYQILWEDLLDETYEDEFVEETSCVPVELKNLYLTLFDYGYEHGFQIPTDLTHREEIDRLLTPIKEHLLETLDEEVIQNFLDQAQRNKQYLYLLSSGRLVISSDKTEGFCVRRPKYLLDQETYSLDHFTQESVIATIRQRNRTYLRAATELLLKELLSPISMSEPVPNPPSPVEEVMAFRIKMGIVPPEVLTAVAHNQELSIQQY